MPIKILRHASRYLVLSTVAFGLSGCGWLFGGENPEPEDAPPIPAVTGMDQRVMYVRPGDNVEIEIHMTDASGEPFEPYSFEWWAAITRLDGGAGWSSEQGLMCDAEPTVETPSPGVRKLSFVAGQRGQCTINIRVKTCGGLPDIPCINTESGEFGPVFVNIMGGETASIAPLQPSVTIVPGETRPVAAIPMLAPDKDGHLYPSGESWTISIPDQSVAVVDGTRRVKGVAPGSTVVEFHAGDAVASIPLNVAAGTIAAPRDGRHRLETIDFDGITDTGDIRGVPVTLTYPTFSHRHRMALDSRGWPAGVFEASAVGVKWHAVLQMEWTGSGFGIQQVGDARDNYWQPQHTIDDRGVRYVAVQSSVMQGLHVAVQKPGYEPGTWDFHQLPRRADLEDERGEPLLLEHDVQLDFDREPMSILKRPGGGAWLAYVAWLHDAADPATPCVRLLRLATATADHVDVLDVEELRFAEGVNGCEGTAIQQGYEVASLLVMPPDPGRSMPKILLLEQVMNASYSYPRLYQANGAQWTRTDWPIDGLLEDGLASTYRLPLQAAVPTPVPAGEPARLVWSMNPDRDSDAFELAYFGSQFDDGPYPVCFCDPGDPVELFAVQNDGSVWVGDGNLSPLLKFTRNGRLVMDRSELLAPEDGMTAEGVAMNSVFGWAADENRLYFMVNHSGYRLDLVTLTPPVMARDGATDAQGARLGDLLTANPMSIEPVVLPDGTIFVQAGARFDLANTHELDSLSGLWRADPPVGTGGASWTKVVTPDPVQAYESPRQFFKVEGDHRVFGITRKTYTGEDVLVESADGGATWTNERGLAGFVFKAVQVGAGLAFVTHQPVEGADGGRPTEVGIWYLPDMTAAQPQPVEIAARVPVPANQYGEISTRLNILPLPEGFVVIMSLDDTAWRSGRLDIRRYDGSGTQIDSWVSGAREELELDVSTAVATRLGEQIGLLMVRGEAEGPGLKYVAHYSSDLFRTESESTLPGHWEGPLTTVALNGGGIAALGTRNVAEDLKRAVSTVTFDGQSWSEPALLRPEGGFDQEVWGAALGTDGMLVVVLGDNQLMCAGASGLDQVMDGIVKRIQQP